MNKVACFVGPSLPDPPVSVPPHVRLLPPARCGDLLRAWHAGYAAIALVDGLFEQGPTVWHKEILHLLGHGVPVLGAASLGAIRAAELDRYGMIGVGTVYRRYRDGVLERDDAVMVAHAPPELGNRPLTVPLVDAEATIEKAIMSQEDGAALRRIARACAFRKRSWTGMMAVFADLHGRERAERVAAAIGPAMTSIKQADTATLLATLADSPPPCRAGVAPPRTPFLDRLLHGIERETRVGRGGQPPSGAL